MNNIRPRSGPNARQKDRCLHCHVLAAALPPQSLLTYPTVLYCLVLARLLTQLIHALSSLPRRLKIPT